jgi:WD40 repeat protein
MLLLFALFNWSHGAMQPSDSLRPEITPENLSQLIEQTTIAYPTSKIVNDFAWSNDSQYLALAGVSGVSLISVTEPQISRFLTTEPAKKVVMHPTKAFMAVISGDQSILLYDLNDLTNGPVDIITQPYVINIEFNQTGDLLAAGSGNGVLELYRCEDRLIHLATLQDDRDDNPPTAFSFNDDSSLLASINLRGGIFIWNLETEFDQAQSVVRPRIIVPGVFMGSMVFSPYVQRFIGIQRFDIGTVLPTQLDEIDSDQNNQMMYKIVGRSEHLLRDEVFYLLAIHPTQPLLAAAGDSNRIVFWETGNFQSDFNLIATVPIITQLAFSPDGTFLAMRGNDNQIRVWAIQE